MTRFRRATPAMLAAVLALAAAGCGDSETTDTGAGQTGGQATLEATPTAAAAGRTGGEMTFGILFDPQNFDVYQSFDTTSVAVWGAWWEYLIRPTKDTKGFEGRLAESFEQSDDDRVYTFKLRQGVTFSNGDPLTTEDVLYSLNRAFSEKTSTIAFLKDKIASMTAPDEQTIRVEFKEPWPYFLGQIAGHMAVILPKKLVERQGWKAYLQKPVGTGPFMWETRDPGSSLRVVRNPNYWQEGKPMLDALTFQVFADDSARVTAVRGGRADLVEGPPPNQLAELGADAKLQTFVFPSTRVDLIAANTKKPPLDDAKVRQAISLAINRQAIVEAGLFGSGEPATTYLVGPPELTLQNTGLDLYPYDPERAKQLLQEAGAQNAKVTLTISEGTVQSVIGEIVKQNLADVGIEATILRKDLASAENDIAGLNYQLSTTFWSDYLPEPTVQPQFAIDPAYCCKAYFTEYDNPAHVKVVKDAIAETDPAARKQAFDDVQRAIAEAANVLPLFFPKLTFVGTAEVAGFHAYPNNMYAFEELGFK
jgi:peptide/nickel transport system substrate-binding protein